jgi:hypothetical protein
MNYVALISIKVQQRVNVTMVWDNKIENMAKQKNLHPIAENRFGFCTQIVLYLDW